MPDAGALEAAKRQMRGGGIPLLVGSTAVGSPDTVRALAASGVDGFATPLSALQALAAAADPEAARGSPEDCVASVLGAPSAAKTLNVYVMVVDHKLCIQRSEGPTVLHRPPGRSLLYMTWGHDAIEEPQHNRCTYLAPIMLHVPNIVGGCGFRCSARAAARAAGVSRSH